MNLTASEKFARFCSDYLVHVKGDPALVGRPIILDDWQIRDIIGPLFDRVDESGRRVIREMFLFIPRKNAKTTLIVAICLYLLFVDPEPSPEIVSAAMDTDQAAISFEIATEMIRKCPALDKRCRIVDSKKTIHHRRRGGYWKVVAADGAGNLGGNLSAILIDELLTQKNRKLYSALKTSTGARVQPLLMCITTAGDEKSILCQERYDYAKKVKTGVIKNEAFLPIIYEADPKDDPFSEATWKKANPGYGKTIQAEYFRNLAAEAKDSNVTLSDLKQYHLNLWSKSGVKWLRPEKWFACAGKIDHTTEKPKVWIAIDMARRVDLAALSMAFDLPEGKIGVRSKGWTNEGAMKTRHENNRFRFDDFVASGDLVKCDGWEVDYDSIYAEIERISESYDIVTIGFDPYNAGDLMQKLEKKGFQIIEFYQRFNDMALPTKEFELDVLNQRIVHEDSQLLTWCMDNVHIVKNDQDQQRPSKKVSSEAIDPAVATIMAAALVRRYRRGEGISVYDQQDVRYL